MVTTPSNNEVAHLLTRYGQLLELSGDGGFRVRAYYRAADVIVHHPESVAHLARQNRLTDLPGIGPAIASAVAEIIASGGLASLTEIESHIPPTLIDLLAIPGVGTKTVSRLFLEHQIVDLPGLQAALIAGKLRGVPGFGAKTEAKILAGIDAISRRTGRMLLGTALPLARRLVDAIQAELPTATASLAGSVRRMEETVGDIDLVVADASPDNIRSAILGLPEVAATLETSESWVRVRLISGTEVDAYLTTPEQFGSTLVRATGNVAHLKNLGILQDAGEEEDVYQRAGLPFIPAELRQGGSEFELARANKLDALITMEDILGEFHCHTTWSDGTGSVGEMADAARRRGYRFLGISDHSRSLGVANGLDEVRIREQRIDINRANADSGIRVFAGAEVEVHRTGELDFAADVLGNLDVVIASLHSGLRQPRRALTDRLERVLRDGDVDIVAHPSGRLLERREPGDFDWDRALAVAAESGTALEINADPARLDLSAEMAERALAAGCLLTINCDAHHPDGFDNLEFGIATARKGGATPDRVLNCWSIDHIEEWLNSRASA
ncbi:MAG: DNA polymerase/3'-5' exonuclease PolX [Thermomicrobiales bacterium]